MGVEQARRDCKRSTSSDGRDEIVVIKEHKPVLSSQDHTITLGVDDRAKAIVLEEEPRGRRFAGKSRILTIP